MLLIPTYLTIYVDLKQNASFIDSSLYNLLLPEGYLDSLSAMACHHHSPLLYMCEAVHHLHENTSTYILQLHKMSLAIKWFEMKHVAEIVKVDLISNLVKLHQFST